MELYLCSPNTQAYAFMSQIGITEFLDAFAYSCEAPVSIVMSVLPSVSPLASISSTPIGGIFVKFDTGDLHENPAKKPKFR